MTCRYCSRNVEVDVVGCCGDCRPPYVHGYQVAAGGLRGAALAAAALSHAVDFVAERVACGRVKLASILDDTAIRDLAPTCPACAAKLARAAKAKGPSPDAILAVVHASSNGASTVEIASALGASTRATYAACCALEEAGMLSGGLVKRKLADGRHELRPRGARDGGGAVYWQIAEG